MPSIRFRKHPVFWAVCGLALLLFLVGAINILGKDGASYRCDAASIHVTTEDGSAVTLDQMSTAAVPTAFRTTPGSLPSGIYDIVIDYAAETRGTLEVTCAGDFPSRCWAQSQSLDPQAGQKTMQFWANEPLEEVSVHITSGGGAFTLKGIRVEEASNSRSHEILCLLLPLLLICLFAGCICWREQLARYALPAVGLVGITLVASLGLLTRYMLFGHDLQFHLLRIEGLKDALLAGSFPARIQPNWAGGWGYPVSVMYGDTSILLPALMRMLGFTVQTSYKTFVIAVNFLTALTSYYTFQKISGSAKLSLLGSLLYTTAPYRLCCIYIRGAFGEYTAMAFLPLLALGFWYAFTADGADALSGGKLLLPAIGLAGMIQTHILTCQMAAVFVVILCAAMWRRLLKKQVFLYLAKIVGLAVLFSLWFLVPFLCYYFEGFNCAQWRPMSGDFQLLGVSLTELFAPMASGSFGYNWSELVDLGRKFSIPLSNALLLALVAALLALWTGRIQKHRKAAGVLLGLGTLAVWMSTNLFPYRFLQRTFASLASFLAKVGLPYRYLSIACLLLSLLAVVLLWQLKGQIGKELRLALAVLLAVLAVSQSMAYTYRVLYGGSYMIYYDGNELDTSNLMGDEYLYPGSSVSEAMARRVCTGTNLALLDSRRDGGRILADCRAEGEGACLEAPLFYYPGYVAADGEGNRYPVTAGSNNCVRVDLPGDFAGTVEISFREPVLWRLAEVVTVLTVLALPAWYLLPSRYLPAWCPKRRADAEPKKK